MKVRDGRPTKKDIIALCEEHGLMIYALDTYAGMGHVIFSERSKANEKATTVAQVIRNEGFDVSLRFADSSKGLTGCIAVKPRRS